MIVSGFPDHFSLSGDCTLTLSKQNLTAISIIVQPSRTTQPHRLNTIGSRSIRPETPWLQAGPWLLPHSPPSLPSRSISFSLSHPLPSTYFPRAYLPMIKERILTAFPSANTTPESLFLIASSRHMEAFLRSLWMVKTQQSGSSASGFCRSYVVCSPFAIGKRTALEKGVLHLGELVPPASCMRG